MRTQSNYLPTFDEHLESINELTKLQLFFLWEELKKYPEEKIEDALYTRTDLARKIDPAPKHYDVAEQVKASHPEWIKLKTAIAEIYKTVNDVTHFEQESFNVIRDTLFRAANLTYGKTGKFDKYQCGSLRYDIPVDKKPVTVFFHIGNALAPQSIFSDKNYLKGCLLNLLAQTEEKYAATHLTTTTWLNSLPKWLEYFPEEWQQNLGDEDRNIRWHFGFWGQFISAKDTFNWKYAKIARETKQLLFYPRHSFCSFEALRKYLT